MRVHETESHVILNGSRDINFTMDLVQKDLSLFAAGDDLVMLAVDVRCHSHVRAALSGGLVSELAERPLEIGAAHVARQSHRTSISSRTKCRRINPGRAVASSK